MSDPETIAELLRQVYADHSTDVDKVFSQIVETTEHPAAAAAFASIMCAPTGQLSFDESLSRYVHTTGASLYLHISVQNSTYPSVEEPQVLF